MLKIHSKRKKVCRRRKADLYSHKKGTVLHQWCQSCVPQANFISRHL